MIVNLKTFVAFFALCPLLLFACGKKQNPSQPSPTKQEPPTIEEELPIQPGAELMTEYLHEIKGKNIGLVVNQTSMVGSTHLVDTLLSSGILVEKIFAPEHGFRGEADAGEKVVDGLDGKTGLPLISLYGKKKKPLPDDLENLDVMVFDIQGVGARFYTYISTLSYIMEACAENNIPLILLDRPNPNGHIVDGPIMESGFESFVGLHAGVPVLHGMTMGEYAGMVNGLGWLANGVVCDLKVIKCQNYSHDKFYELPIRPSPNLPNMRSIYLYPSLCFFEGTNVSVGRGTYKQFQVLGMPGYPSGDFTFTPRPKPGAKYPKHENITCRGYDFSEMSIAKLQDAKTLNINWLVDFYANCSDRENFFLKNNFIDKLSGGKTLRQQIIDGKTAAEIRTSWESGLKAFMEMREEYLLYN